MKGYKEDQGRLARMAAFWSVTLLVLFGCTFIHDILIQWDSMAAQIAGIRLPVVGVDLTWAFLISVSLFTVGVVMTHRWQRRPKVADLLIDTEAELKKVNWPTMQEVMNSSMVVIVCVLLIGAFLAFADLFLARIMKVIIFGGA